MDDFPEYGEVLHYGQDKKAPVQMPVNLRPSAAFISNSGDRASVDTLSYTLWPSLSRNADWSII